MEESTLNTGEYSQLFRAITERIRSAQHSALKMVNNELISLYWDIGRMILERQRGDTWGKSVVVRLAADLQRNFPELRGFSSSNLWRMKVFYQLYSNNRKLAPMVREIGWTHNILILERCKDDLERLPDENPSIGIILCKTKNRTIVEYAIKNSRQPLGVAQYRMLSKLPKRLAGQLPSPKQIEKLLGNLD